MRPLCRLSELWVVGGFDFLPKDKPSAYHSTVMLASLPVRFADMFFKGFFPSMKEKLIHAVLMVGALGVAYLKGKAHEQFWEIVAPVVWVLSVFLAFHAIRTAIKLYDEVRQEQNTGTIERESSILSPSGARAKFLVVPEPVRFGGLQIFTIAAILCVIAILLSYLTLQRIRAEAVPLLPPSAPPAPLPSISYQCAMKFLPISVPAGGTVHVLALNQKANPKPGWGLYEVANGNSSKAMTWPDANLMRQKTPNPGTTAYKCEITNHGPGDLPRFSHPCRSEDLSVSANSLGVR